MKEAIQQVIEEALADENITARRIILFGSRARGDARSDSDWDLFVLVDREIDVPQQQRLTTAIRRQLARQHIPNDVLILSEAQFAARREIPGLISYAAAHEGVPL